jgi:hypothetical protein
MMWTPHCLGNRLKDGGEAVSRTHFYQSSLFGPNIILNTLILCPSLNVREKISHPYKSRDKIIVIFSFLDSIRVHNNSGLIGSKHYPISISHLFPLDCCQMTPEYMMRNHILSSKYTYQQMSHTRYHLLR